MERCNECIKCTVEQCRHHHNTKNYCTLESIQVGTHEMNPTKDQCTDCMSFAVKEAGALYRQGIRFFCCIAAVFYRTMGRKQEVGA